MPELPEVETVRRGLESALVGRRIARAKAFVPKLRIPVPDDFSKTLEGRRVEGLSRRAKYIVIHLDSPKSVLLHLGMSGQVRIVSSTYERAKHDHFIWNMERGPSVVFHDPRRFGLVTFCPGDGLGDHPLLKGLGPEPLSNAFNGPVLREALKAKKVSIKQALLDQRVVAGVGNIYASEALFRAGINPKRKAGSLSEGRCETLAGCVRRVLEDALESGGSSLKDFVRVDGELGYFQHRFDVYDHENVPCKRKECSGKVRRIVQGQRSTFYCPKCQR